MTLVNFYSQGGHYSGFSLRGHSSLGCEDELGKLVCSAVSSAAYMAVNTITEVIGDKSDITVNDAEMAVKLKKPNEFTDAVIKGFLIHIRQLSEQYSNNIKVYSEV